MKKKIKEKKSKSFKIIVGDSLELARAVRSSLADEDEMLQNIELRPAWDNDEEVWSWSLLATPQKDVPPVKIEQFVRAFIEGYHAGSRSLRGRLHAILIYEKAAHNFAIVHDLGG